MIIRVKKTIRDSWFIRSPPLLDRPDHHAPDLEIVVRINSYGLVVPIGRTQLDISLLTMRQVEILDGELLVDVGDYHVAIIRLD